MRNEELGFLADFEVSEIKKKRFGFDFWEEKSKMDLLDFGEEMAEVKIDKRKFFELRKKKLYNRGAFL